MRFPFISCTLKLVLTGLSWFQPTQAVGVVHAECLVEISIIIQMAKFRSTVILPATFQNVDMTTIVSKQRLTFKSDKSTTYLDNATPIVRIQRCVAILIQNKI